MRDVRTSVISGVGSRTFSPDDAVLVLINDRQSSEKAPILSPWVKLIFLDDLRSRVTRMACSDHENGMIGSREWHAQITRMACSGHENGMPELREWHTRVTRMARPNYKNGRPGCENERITRMAGPGYKNGRPNYV